ncbi:MAG: hypothetical protein PHR51_00340 [Patescibacteria group bacterium]|nr:hypothetical protein [Patescibacteria group bacterium]
MSTFGHYFKLYWMWWVVGLLSIPVTILVHQNFQFGVWGTGITIATAAIVAALVFTAVHPAGWWGPIDWFGIILSVAMAIVYGLISTLAIWLIPDLFVAGMYRHVTSSLLPIAATLWLHAIAAAVLLVAAPHVGNWFFLTILSGDDSFEPAD